MGFIARIEKELDLLKHKSRFSRSKAADPKYTLEDAISDYSKYAVFASKKVEEDYYAYIRRLYERQEKAATGLIYAVIEDIRSKVSDYRKSPDKVHYPLDVLIFLILITRVQGIVDCDEIADYYNLHYLELFVLVPGIPKYRGQLSVSTIQVAMSMLSPEQISRFFEENFTKIKITIEEQVLYHKERIESRPEGIKDTLGFDGQEMKGTYRRGEKKRKCKGGIVTQLYNCTQRVPLGFEISSKKNHERDDILPILSRITIDGMVVMCDDLNSQAAVSNAVIKANGIYMFPLGKNGNKELLIHVEAIFNRQHKDVQSWESKKPTKKQNKRDHGRYDFTKIEILPAEPYLDPRINKKHKNVRTLIKYTKISKYYINDELVKETEDVTYYISSLAYAEEYTLQQVVASLEDYWQIETSHAVLDSHHLFHQDALHACLPTTMKNVAAFNKIGTAVLSYIRQRMSIKECRKKPHSYKLIKSRCQSMGLESLLIYLYDYWFDRVEQTDSNEQ